MTRVTKCDKKQKSVTAPEGDNADKGAGNTKNRPRVRSCHWFLTLNNPTDKGYGSYTDLIDLIAVKEPISYMFQLEKGKEGTEHYQGVFSFKNAISFDSIRALDKHIHWEVCKSLKKAIVYCSKSDTRVSGPWCKGMQAPINKAPKPRGWQVELMKMLDEEPNDRSVFWLYEKEGNVGKTTFGKYLEDYGLGAYYPSAKKSDIVFDIANNGCPRIICIDIARNHENAYVSWDLIEELKNGRLFSTKYKSCRVRFNPPHVVVFCNQPPPNESKLSKDRWQIYHIEKDRLVKKDKVQRMTLEAAVAQSHIRAAHMVDNELDFDN